MYINSPPKVRSRFAFRSAARAAISLFCIGLALPLQAQYDGAGADRERKEVNPATFATADDFVENIALFDEDIHEIYFTYRLYEGTGSCMLCHESEAYEMLDSGHFKWAGKADNIVGMEGMEVGKKDLLNNFCIATPSNEARCTQCHAGLGYGDAGFDFNDPTRVDCLVCHDQSGTYKKGLKSAGMPDESVDLDLVARSIRVGQKPTRKACIGCHASAGGGDNVKHGDLSTDMVATTREFDVHMGVDGANLVCADCHGANHDPRTGNLNHGIAGMSLHSIHEGEMRECADCHGGRDAIHADNTARDLFNEDWHDRLACQVCHIPAIARSMVTKVEWYWSDAGKSIDPVPLDPVSGRPTWDKKKGTFAWRKNVRPTLRFANGKWQRMVIGMSDTYDELPIRMAEPVGDHTDPSAMIFPFKLMVGDQPVDPVNQRVIVPHLFGKTAGPNPYWGAFDWGLALEEGAAYAGQEYSGSYEFAPTTMLLSVNHEIAPAEHALGMGGFGDGCMDCHDSGLIDWEALGWSHDPLDGGTRPDAVASFTSNPDGTQ